MRLRPARAAEADALTDLALRSKAHWGYDAAFIEACRAELTITPDRIADEAIVVAEADGRIVGFVAVKGDALEDLFAESDSIGTGVGSALLAAAVDIARTNGVAALRVEADPHAVDWYRARGAVDTGTTVPSGSIPGRSLPLLTMPIRESRSPR